MPGLSVTIEFEDVDAYETDYYHRTITLTAPKWEAPIGRSTSSSQGQRESPNNALFSSRVVSREHARLRANPESRLVTIEDVGSMHGTHLEGRRLQAYHPEPLYDGSTVIFGAEVERVEEGSAMTFKPKKVEIYYNWSDHAYNFTAPQDQAQHNITRNSFSADYTDDEPTSPQYDFEEDKQRSPSVIEVTRTFTVPDESSDASDEIISIISDEDIADAQSPTSSPVGSLDLAEKPTGKATHTRAAPASSIASYADLDLIPLSDDDSYYQDSSIFDGDEDEDDEDEEIEADAQRPVQLTSKITVEIPGILPRDPSPSDAAMVKPATATKSPPFPQLPSITAFQGVRSDVASASSSFSSSGRYQSAWAGHNSVLYEPMPVSQGLEQKKIAPFSQSPPWRRPSVGPYAASTSSNGWDFLPGVNAPITAFTDDVINEIPELAEPDFPSHFAEVIDEYDAPRYPEPSTVAAINAETKQQLKSCRKRKAEEMTTDEPAISNTVSVPVSVNSMPTVELTQTIPSSLKSPLPLVCKSVEPSKKKTKTSKSDCGTRPAKRGLTFAQLASTALVGAVVGAVGMVYGLASLPADYFV